MARNIWVNMVMVLRYGLFYLYTFTLKNYW